MKKYEPMKVTHLETSHYVETPTTPIVLHIDDPALDAMLDFKKHKVMTITAEENIATALIEMKATGSHLLFVVDAEQQVIGMISSEDIQGTKPYRIMQERRIKHGQILVRMLMTTHHHIPVLNKEDLQLAKVGHLVSTFNQIKKHYLLVQEKDAMTQDMHIRGLFSASQLSRSLHANVTDHLSSANSIIELQHDWDQ